MMIAHCIDEPDVVPVIVTEAFAQRWLYVAGEDPQDRDQREPEKQQPTDGSDSRKPVHEDWMSKKRPPGHNMARRGMPTQINWYLREWMESLGVKQAEMIRRTDWSKATMSQLYNNKQDYSPKIVNEAALALNVAPYELLMRPDTAMALRRLRQDALRVVEEGMGEMATTYVETTPAVIEALRDSKRYLTEFGCVDPNTLAARIDAELASLAPLTRLSNENRDAVASWLRDCANDARESDPSVGIWANEQMADAFDALILMIGGRTLA
jgi:transcriptional regulator with XRE-family HTH domain